MPSHFIDSNYLNGTFDPNAYTGPGGRLVYDTNSNSLYFAVEAKQPLTQIASGGGGGGGGGPVSLGETQLDVEGTFTISGAITWNDQQKFGDNVSLTPGHSLYLNGVSDSNWRFGLGMLMFNAGHVQPNKAVQIIHGAGNDSGMLDGFAVTTCDGDSLIETTGHDKVVHFTASGGTEFDNWVKMGALPTSVPPTNYLYNWNGFVAISQDGLSPGFRQYALGTDVDTGDTFIDGKRIYRRVLSFTNAANGDSTVLDDTLTPSSVGCIVSISGTFREQGGGSDLMFAIPFADPNGNGAITVYLQDSGLTLEVGSPRQAANTGYVVIEYTQADFG